MMRLSIAIGSLLVFVACGKIASKAGIGDPCVVTSECPEDSQCRGFCSNLETEICDEADPCVGRGPNGGNSKGLPLLCVDDEPGGALCEPGCSTDADCAAFTNEWDSDGGVATAHAKCGQTVRASSSQAVTTCKIPRRPEPQAPPPS